MLESVWRNSETAETWPLLLLDGPQIAPSSPGHLAISQSVHITFKLLICSQIKVSTTSTMNRTLLCSMELMKHNEASLLIFMTSPVIVVSTSLGTLETRTAHSFLLLKMPIFQSVNKYWPKKTTTRAQVVALQFHSYIEYDYPPNRSVKKWHSCLDFV